MKYFPVFYRLVIAASCYLAISANAQERIFSQYEEQVLEAYLAYYGRPADPGGLAYWAGRLENENGVLSSIIDAFGTSQEYQNRFGSLTSTELVTNLYQQMFGREPDSGGLEFYVGKLDSGQWNLQKISLAIIDGVQGNDVDIVNNRLEISKYYVVNNENNFIDELDAEEMSSLIGNIGSSDESLSDAYDAINLIKYENHLSWSLPRIDGEFDLYTDEVIPWETQVIDFDRDNDLDIVISYSIWPTEDRRAAMQFLENDGLGNFTNVTDILYPSGGPSTIWARETLVADFNGDEINDIFIADHGIDSAPFDRAKNTLLLGGATKLVDATENLPDILDFSHSATFGDIDGDSDLDIFVGNYYQIDSYFLINNGQGVFEKSEPDNNFVNFVSVSSTPDGTQLSTTWTSSLLVDTDNDGDLDLLGGGDIPQDGPLVIWENNGSGLYTKNTSLIPQSGFESFDALIQSLEAVDIDDDNDLDILVVVTRSDYIGAKIFTLINNGSGVFVDSTDQRIDVQPVTEGWVRSLHPIDVDNDGDKDFFLEGEWEGHALYLNTGDGHFVLNNGNADLAIYQTPWDTKEPDGQLEFGDFNGDGSIDILSIRGEAELHLYEGSQYTNVSHPTNLGGTAIE